MSTILGRFVIPIYYVLGERLIDWFGRNRVEEEDDEVEAPAVPSDGHASNGAPLPVPAEAIAPGH